MAVSHTGGRYVSQTAVLSCTLKFGFDPAGVPGPGQQVDGSSLISFAVATQLLTNETTRAMIHSGSSLASATQPTLLQEASYGLILQALEVLNKGEMPEAFSQNVHELLTTNARARDLLPTDAKGLLSNLEAYDRMVQSFRVYGSLLTCLEQQLRGHMAQRAARGKISHREYDDYLITCSHTTHPPAGGYGVKDQSAVEVLLDTFFYSIDSMRRQFHRRVAEHFKERGQRREAPMQELVDVVLALLLENRRPVEDYHKLTQRYNDGATLKEFLKEHHSTDSLVAPKAKTLATKPAGAAHVYSMRDERYQPKRHVWRWIRLLGGGPSRSLGRQARSVLRAWPRTVRCA